MTTPLRARSQKRRRGLDLGGARAGGRSAVEWVFAALNSVEMASLPWSILAFSGNLDSPAGAQMKSFLELRLDRMERVLAGREWLAGEFSVANIAMQALCNPPCSPGYLWVRIGPVRPRANRRQRLFPIWL